MTNLKARSGSSTIPSTTAIVEIGSTRALPPLHVPVRENDPGGGALLQVVYAEYRVLLSAQRTLLAFARTALAISLSVMHFQSTKPWISVILGTVILVCGGIQYVTMTGLILAGRPAWKRSIVGWFGCAIGWHWIAGSILILCIAGGIASIATGTVPTHIISP